MHAAQVEAGQAERWDELHPSRFISSASKLSTYRYPVLRDIVGCLREAAAGVGAIGRLSFRAAHDTVLAPLLQALRVLRVGDHAWPWYASRVMSELWTGPGGTAAVRLLFNGEDWTARLACAQAVVSVDGSARTGLCLLPAFEAQVQGLLKAGVRGDDGAAPAFNTWGEACAVAGMTAGGASTEKGVTM